MPVSVYLETSFISACVTDRADPASIYRRDTSQQWWASQAQRYGMFISAEVLAELSHPGFRRSRDAISFVRELPLWRINDDVRGLATVLVREKVMPAPVAGDAIHVAVATIYGADYILSWNVRHLANPSKTRHLQAICLRAGLVPPKIVTPDLLWEEDDE